MPELDGKVVLITGAAGGVGRATTLRLAKAGATVALVGRTPVTLDALKRDVEAIGGRAISVPADVSDEPAVQWAVGETERLFGGIDALINNAGIAINGPADKYDLTSWRRVMDTNLTGAFVCSKAAIEPLRRRGGGQIVAIASGAARQGYANMSAYCASKFGLVGLMQALAAELSADRIKVSILYPGSILTAFGTRSREEKLASGNKYLEAEDVAEAILYLLTRPDRAWPQEMTLWPY